MGLYLQVECGAWAEVGSGLPQDEWIRQEGDRILKEYGNHPSFCLMAYGNEPSGNRQADYLGKLVNYWKQTDGRRVYTSAAGWPYVPEADFWSTMEPRIQVWGAGLNSVINREAPRTDYDWREIIRKDMPTVSHEIGQWCVYPRLKEREKYTGVLKAGNFDILRLLYVRTEWNIWLIVFSMLQDVCRLFVTKWISRLPCVRREWPDSSCSA